MIHYAYRAPRFSWLARLALMCVFLLPLSTAAAPLQTVSHVAAPGLQLVSTTTAGIEFDWVPALHLLTWDGTLECDVLTVPDAISVDIAGWPAVPASGALFGLPHAATDLELEILEIEYRDLPGSYSLCPVPRPVWEQVPDETPVFLGNAWDADAEAYALDSYWPRDVAVLTEEGYLRQQRIGQVALYPFQYLPATGQLRSIQRIRARLSFTAESVAAEEGAPSVVDAYEPLYRDALVNYEQARGWRQPARGAGDLPVVPQSEPTQRVKLSIEQEGMVRLTGSDLAAAGVPIGQIDPQTLRLYHQDKEIARRVVQAVPGPMQPGDALVFMGESIDSIYTETNVYWVGWGDGNGLDMAMTSGDPTGSVAPSPLFYTEHLFAKQERAYLSNNPMPPDDDRWYWGVVLAGGAPVTRVFTTTVTAPATEPLTATLRVYLAGYSTSQPLHSARVEWNGHLVGESTWAFGGNAIFDVIIPQAHLLEGENSLSVTAGLGLVGGQYDYVYLHRIEIDYGRRYEADGNQLTFAVDEPGDWLVGVGGWTGVAMPDLYNITDPLFPVRITDAVFEPGVGEQILRLSQSITQTERYVALTTDRYSSPAAVELVTLSNWADLGHGADYIIITHGDFYDAIQPLASYRSAQGLRVIVIDVEDLYDEFGHGIVGPHGIRELISHAYHNWSPPAPAYVLLVGDGNFDPKNNFGRGEISYLPPFLGDVDPWMGETVADNQYVTVHGDDIFPDLFLGRLPVKTAAETTAIVNKILAYEALGRESWQRQITFLADDADNAGDFALLSEVIVTHFTPPPYVPERIYYKVTPGHGTEAELRNALFNAFNEGRLIINYKGHAAISSWAANPVFFRLADVETLANGHRQPFMVPMTCLEGYYISPSVAGGPDRSSVSEALVRLEGRGAIASFAPSGFGIATGHEFLNKGLFEALFYDSITELGPATTLAKLRLYTGTPGYRELIETYLLMGDPALTLKAQRLQWLPISVDTH